jgi:hypothetical protein
MKNIYLGNNSFANVKIPEYMRQFLSLGKRDSQLCFIVFVNRIIDTAKTKKRNNMICFPAL